VLRIGADNPSREHRRSQGELARLRQRIVPSTAAGIDLAPRSCGPTWKQFLTAQAHSILACDFPTVDTVRCRSCW
jgi:hypothetical protein